MTEIILIRHGIALKDFSTENPALSEEGKAQARVLALKLRNHFDDDKTPIIWASPAARAKETAEIIKSELGLNDISFFDELWSDLKHEHNLDWLLAKFKEHLQNPRPSPLIVVTHSEYVQLFPLMIGLPATKVQNGEAIIIHDFKSSSTLF